MKLFIPPLGTALRLRKPWTLQVHIERRNSTLIKHLGYKYEDFLPTHTWDSYARCPNCEQETKLPPEPPYRPVWRTCSNCEGLITRRSRNFVKHPPKLDPLDLKYTFPAGTELTLDRIYIRQGNAEFDSVTFTCARPDGKKGRVRFWAKLPEVNQMDVVVEKKKA